MGQSEKIDSRRFYEAGFAGVASSMSKNVLMVMEQLFSTTNRDLFIPLKKAN